MRRLAAARVDLVIFTLVITVLAMPVFFLLRSCSKLSALWGKAPLIRYNEKRALKLASKASKG